MDDEHGTEYTPDEATSAQINIAQIIQGQMLLLISDMATVDAGTKFNNLAPMDFQQFYSHFLEIFLIAHNLLSPETVQPIEVFFRDSTDLSNKTVIGPAAMKAISLAHSMKKDLVEKGLWQVFVPAGEPPFMMDEVL